MDFSSFEYKRKNEFQSHMSDKKPKVYDKNHNFRSPNILVFCPSRQNNIMHDVKFVIGDPSGEIIERNTCCFTEFLTILGIARENECVIVTYDLKNILRAHHSAERNILNEAVFCILEESFIRTGLTKIDQKVKSSTCEDIYNLLFGVQPEDDIQKCDLILKCFIGGRIKGWF
tara:strand:- start:2283 stop:2801 length:519 start_codon:yes stop_codon:yes gene_type:complete